MIRLVTAVIKPHRVEAVMGALRGAGIQGLTLTEVRGFGRQGGHTETYRGAEYRIDFIPKVKVEVLVGTEDAERVAKVVADAARTGQIGDGKVWITPVDRVMRVRTGEQGSDAL